MFARVVQRQGWDVELIEAGNAERPRTLNFDSQEKALAHAMAQDPEWIEVGVVVPAAGSVPQHHRWHTLRRGAGGGYSVSALSWGGNPGQAAT